MRGKIMLFLQKSTVIFREEHISGVQWSITLMRTMKVSLNVSNNITSSIHYFKCTFFAVRNLGVSGC